MNNISLGIIFLTVFLDLVGFGIVIPILPYYAKAYGASGWALGWLMTSYSLMQFIFAPIWGRISDQKGRRPVLLISILGSAISMTILGFADSLVWLFVGRIFAGICGANISTAYAYIADVTTEENRTKGMGIIGAGFGLGFIFGPAIGGLLSHYGFGVPMFAAALLAIVNLLFTYFKLAEPQLAASVRATHSLKRFDLRNIGLALSDPRSRFAVGMFLLVTFAITQMEVVFALFLSARFNYNAKEAGLLLALSGVVMTLMQGGIVGRLAKIFGELTLIVTGTAICGISLIFFAYTPSISILIGSLIVLSIGHGLLHPSLSSMASKGATNDGRGATMGIFQSAGSLARVIGPPCAGWLFDEVGISSPFYFAALILVAGFLISFRQKATKLILLIITSNFLFLPLSAKASPMTLKMTLSEAYQAALQKTESPAIASSKEIQALERLAQAKGGVLPSLSLLTSYTKPDQTTAKITLSQPLFRGLREFAAIRATKDDLEVQKATVLLTKQILYKTVAQVFYRVLSAERDMSHLDNQIKLTERRALELSQRNKIGRSRRGEVLSANAQVAALKAQLEAAGLELSQARDQFLLVTGLEIQALEDDDKTWPPINIESMSSYIGLIENRGDIRALIASLQSAQEKVAVAHGAHLPSLDLSSNYYIKRSGVLENSKWDVGVSLSLPIFQGGIVSSQVREALERVNEQELLLAQGRRQALDSIRSSYKTLVSTLAQYRALEEALKLSKDNYNEQERDYRLGLVTNIEVLQALNSLQDNKRSLDRTRFQGKSAFITLEASAGRAPSQ